MFPLVPQLTCHYKQMLLHHERFVQPVAASEAAVEVGISSLLLLSLQLSLSSLAEHGFQMFYIAIKGVFVLFGDRMLSKLGRLNQNFAFETMVIISFTQRHHFLNR